MAKDPMSIWNQLLKVAVDAATGAGSMILPEKMSDILTGPVYAVRHPLDSAKLMGGAMQDASQDQFEKMYAAPTLMEALGHGAAGALPMIGPAAAATGEEIGTGNPAKGLGMMAALLAPSAYHGLKPALAEVAAAYRAPRLAAAAEAAARAKADSEFAAFNRTNPNALASLDTPSSNVPLSGPTGSLAQLRDQPLLPVPDIDPLTGLPTRRTALKVGGGAAVGAMLAPKLMETVKATPPVEAAPVLGRNAPSALGREGFYRDPKFRVQEMFDSYDYPEMGAVTDPSKVPYMSRTYVGTPDPNVVIGADLPKRLENGEFGHMGNVPGQRHFLSRVELEGPNGPVYGKQVFSMDPKHEPLVRALKDYTEAMRNKHFATGVTTATDSEKLPIKRIVHSEITPEAALRLNTIEKPKVGSMVLDKVGRKRTNIDISKVNDDTHTFHKIVDDGGQVVNVVATPNSGFEPTMSAINRTANDFYGKIDDSREYRNKEDYLNHRWQPGRTINIEEISKSDALAIAKSEHDPSYKGYFGQERSRPNTIGISPRYTKRVSIRLLKDAMADQIKENRRAAGLKSPPLLARPPLLQDNPALSRMELFRRKK